MTPTVIIIGLTLIALFAALVWRSKTTARPRTIGPAPGGGNEGRTIRTTTTTRYTIKAGSGGSVDLTKLPPGVANLVSADLAWAKQQAAAVKQPGFDAIKVNDPSFSVQDFESRAVKIIRDIRDAERSGQADMVRQYMSDRFFPRWQLQAQTKQPAAVGVVSMVSATTVAAVESTALMDQITMRNVEKTAPSGVPVSTCWLFIRSAAGRSGGGSSMSVSVCSNCGAPADSATGTTCRYCGSALTLLGAEWVVDNIYPEAAAPASAA
jgi:hypothetical protein